MASETPFFQVDVQERRLKFSSFEEIENWIANEKSKFKWLMRAGDLGPQFNSLRSIYQSGLNHLTARLQEWRSTPGEAVRAQTLAKQFHSFYGNPQVVMSDHAFAKIAQDAGKMGEMASVGAFCLLLGVPCSLTFETVRGVLHASLVKDGIEPKSANLVSSAIQSLNSAAETEFKKRDDQWNLVSANAQQASEESRHVAQEKVDELSQQTEAFLERLNREGAEVIKSIQATEAAYKEQMTLQAPVDYWLSKADDHKKAMDHSRGRLLKFAWLGSIGIIVGLILLSWVATLVVGTQTHDSTAVYLKFAAVGAIFTTIIFWVGRVLLRIYLSDRHLLTDAEERVAMIRTYLALTHSGKVEPTERALVLAPIFRSAADGIVKEEGPDASFAGVLARALDIKGRT